MTLLLAPAARTIAAHPHRQAARPEHSEHGRARKDRMSNYPHYVRLINGRLIDPWDPAGPAPEPEVVAHGLANLCRYGGHVARPYSVAEHTIWCAVGVLIERPLDENAVRFFAEPLRLGAGGAVARAIPHPRLALLALVHDAPEGCGLVDVPGPVLRHSEMQAYKEAHERCHRWLLDGWGIAPPTAEEAAAVKAVDVSILGAEMAIRPPRADGVEGSGESLPPWPGLDLSKVEQPAGYWHETWIDFFHFLKEAC